MKLTHDTILITGGTTGLGLEMANQLSKMGNTVIVTGRNKNRLDEIKKNFPNIHVYTVEVTELASMIIILRPFPFLKLYFELNNNRDNSHYFLKDFRAYQKPRLSLCSEPRPYQRLSQNSGDA